MARESTNSLDRRISAAFASRLKGLEPEQTVRALLLLNIPRNGPKTGLRNGAASGQRLSPAARKALIEAARRSTDAVLSAVDRVLSKYGGRRLAADVDALGSLPVETTTSGLLALAGSKQVRAILEDQEIKVLDGRRSK